MNHLDKKMTFGEWNEKYMAGFSTVASRKQVKDAAGERDAINTMFAKMFDGDIDATTEKVMACGFSQYSVENSSAYEDAANGDDVADLCKMYA